MDIELRLLWLGSGLVLLAVAPSLLFALDARLLGGPAGWYLRNAAISRRRSPRAAGLIVAWTGTCISAIVWALAFFPAVRISPGPAILVPSFMLLAIVPPAIVQWHRRPSAR